MDFFIAVSFVSDNVNENDKKEVFSGLKSTVLFLTPAIKE
jgi:hypothetical protein